MKKLLLIFALLFSSSAFASTLTIPTVYAPNGQVTSTNLNGDFAAIASIVNGSLDNTNADTVDGYRFFEVKSSLPSFGTQGRVVFLTSDNSLNLDTGASFSKFHENPIGEIILWPTAVAPTNYLICDGSEVNRTTYAALYAVIGTTYGIGDGASTFNIPDFRGLFPVGQKVADANFDALKTPTTYVGEKTHTLTTPEIPAHTHSIVNKDDESGQDDVIVGRATGTQRTYNTGSAGGDGAHNNLPPYIVINFAIKYQ